MVGVRDERPDREPVATVALLPAPGMPVELAKAVARRLSRDVSARGLSIEVLANRSSRTVTPRGSSRLPRACAK